MLKVAHGIINPILDQYLCLQMNLSIGIDRGKNAIIQSGRDVHQKLNRITEDQKKDTIIGKTSVIKTPIYDILGFTTNLAVKMTALANPNRMIIGQLVYDTLDKDQQSMYELLNISPEIWNYVNDNSGGAGGGKIYNLYKNIP